MTTLRLALLVREPYPTFRADVDVLFGKYLPRLGIGSVFISEQVPDPKDAALPVWGGGQVITWDGGGPALVRQVQKFVRSIQALVGLHKSAFDAIQVRDMALTAVTALAIARARRKPFFFWMSFPMVEAQVDRARRTGVGGGLGYWFPLLQGLLGKAALKYVVLPFADHIFVQSDRMRDELAQAGVPIKKMTPVPMGVDLESLRTIEVPADSSVTGERRIVHLGVLDPIRESHRLLDIVAGVRVHAPDVVLLLVGDAETRDYGIWFREEIVRRGLGDAVRVTGWLTRADAWEHVRSADLGISLIPRNVLLDAASPTKVVECLALGLPMVVNDQPEQAKVIGESKAGLCVQDSAEAFVEGIVGLLSKPELIRTMRTAGPAYVRLWRSYSRISEDLAASYKCLLNVTGRAAALGGRGPVRAGSVDPEKP